MRDDRSYCDAIVAAIHAAMTARKISYRELADASGVPHTTILGWVRQRKRPRLYAALAVLSALSIDFPPIAKKAAK